MGDKKEPRSFARRDHLRANEIKVQAQWENQKLFESHVDNREKFFVTFPYPYMNGRLHLGHAFSLTKAEFTARFQRMMGKNVLFPFGFHCTGMPIQAAANKLREEIAAYGNPPVFPAEQLEDLSVQGEVKSAEAENKGKGKKTKLATKGITGKIHQWDILAKMVDKDEISQFVDPLKWLSYFPPLGVHDLKSFGSSIDWRRSFITTAVNPYYDKFIQWQFNRLKAGGKIKSGFRPSIYSVKDRQVCADHDRSSGEGVCPQEYVCIKLRVLETSKLSLPENKNIFLVAATLRPETMYGQTNCFVLPEGEYGAFSFQDDEIYIMSERSALGLAHQGFAKEWGSVQLVKKFLGSDLLGLPVEPPLSVFRVIYTLPLITISMFKGTGIVTSVPSDAPDDYIALKEMKEKPLWREKFGISENMVREVFPVPIIEIPGYGSLSAVELCEAKQVKSSKDKEKLQEIKDAVYLKAFYEGTMLIGEYKGYKVQEAKPFIKKNLIDHKLAFSYFEPESTVISRTGDECIVALTDQWYLTYGDPDWKQRVLDHLNSDKFNSYNLGIKEAMLGAVDWLKEWACSREFGLGTQLPWDPKWVIDSLSDSTIYMAYYTLAHYWHGEGNLEGSNNDLPADLFCDEVFNYIFEGSPLSEELSSKYPLGALEGMRKEFCYWYPLDLRVSAKDLIPNHLTMCLYNHSEIWATQPELWPRGIYCNGHIMVDAEKMSKSRGNFLLLLECVEEYSADATRFALADAGDGLEDANFDRSVANQAISYLFIEEEWIKAMLGEYSESLSNEGSFSFLERAFNNEINFLIEETKKNFEVMNFREGLHRCWYDMIINRDLYREWAQKSSRKLNNSLIRRFANSLALMMQPICPHWSEIIFQILHPSGSTSVCLELWPVFEPYNPNLRKEYSFFKSFLKTIRNACAKQKMKTAYIFVASTYEPKKVEILEFMRSNYANGNFSTSFIKDLKAFIDSHPHLKSDAKSLMQFGSFVKSEAEEIGVDALDITLPFDQYAILQENKEYLRSVLEVEEIYIFHSSETTSPDHIKKAEQAVPGKPSFFFSKS